MDRKATARETLRILEQGYYLYGDQRISIEEAHRKSVKGSVLITPEEGTRLLKAYEDGNRTGDAQSCCTVGDISTVEAAWKLFLEGKKDIAILNFASAKNPGGGFLNGAMAQEESLAASSGLYKTLTVHEEYYRNNRACPSMMYTDHAIYSPEVVFFRDGGFRLLEKPFPSSVLTLPAVNMGQVLLKGEDCGTAEHATPDEAGARHFCRERSEESGPGSVRMRSIQKRSGKNCRMVGGTAERRVQRYIRADRICSIGQK